MRILVCTKKDLLGNIALNRLLPRLKGHRVFVFFSEKTRPAELNDPDLRVLKFLERDLPNRFLFPLIEQARPQRSSRSLTFEELAAVHGFPTQTVRRINDPATVATMREIAPDLILSVRFSLIFRPITLGIPRFGVLNIHPGALPDYGGLFAPLRQMLNGDMAAGCTLHYVDDGIDTGPIVESRTLTIDPGRSMLWHLLRLYPLGIDAAVRAIAQLAAGQAVTATAQSAAERRYYSMPRAEEIASFHDRGFRLYDFDEYLADMRNEFGSFNGEALLSAAKYGAVVPGEAGSRV